MAEFPPNMWTPHQEWRSTVQVRFAGTHASQFISVEMDVVLRDQFERWCKSMWKNDVKVILNGGQPLSAQHTGVIAASFEVSCNNFAASYNNGFIRFVSATDGSVKDTMSVEPPPGNANWDGVPKEAKLRIAFKTLFIHMVREGFIMPGAANNEVKHIAFTAGRMSVV